MTILLKSEYTNLKVKSFLIFLLIYSCSFSSKDNYLMEFTEFISEVEINFQNYSKEDWNFKDVVFRDFTTKSYNHFKEDFTEDDQKLIGKLKTKYHLAKSKYEMKILGEQIKDGVNQIKGALEEVLDQDNLDHIGVEENKSKLSN